MGERKRETKTYLVLAFLVLLLLGSGIYFNKNQETLFSYLKNTFSHPSTALKVLFLIKFFGIVYPPFPGGLFLILAVPFLGWEIPFLANFLGSFLGGVVNYWVARLWGKKAIKFLLGEEGYKKIEEIKIKKGRELEFLFLARVGLVGMLEGIQYSAGLLRIPFFSYLLVSVFSDLAIGLVVFYLLDKGWNLFSFKGYPALFLLSLLVLLFFYLGKGRYLE